METVDVRVESMRRAGHGNRGVLVAALLISAPFAASSQSRIESQNADALNLQCEFTPVQPALDFALRFRAGYKVNLSLSQFRGASLTGRTDLQVTPDGGLPKHILARFSLSEAPQMSGYAQIAGSFAVSEGNYTVDAVVEDGRHRTCHGQWRIRAGGNGLQRLMRLPGTPATVGDESFVPGGAPGAGRQQSGQLTILLHAAPLLPNAGKLPASDVSMLIGSLSSLLEQLPARTVTLVVFNLEQQAVLFREDGFAAADISRVAGVISQLQLGLVNYATLQRAEGAAGFLQDLTEEQFKKAAPDGALVFLGPHARVQDSVTADAVKGFQGGPRVFYVEHQPQVGLRIEDDDDPYDAAAPDLPCGAHSHGACAKADGLYIAPPDGWRDSIEKLVSRLKGETLVVRQPSDLVRAIRRIATRQGRMPSAQVAAKR